jgi:hypothetical protein
MNRDKVESVDVDQTLLGRIFGYGTLIVRGTGGSLEPIRTIGDPLDLSQPYHCRPRDLGPDSKVSQPIRQWLRTADNPTRAVQPSPREWVVMPHRRPSAGVLSRVPQVYGT